VTDANLTWTKSSYSGSQGGNCIEAAADGVGRVLVRDTKDRGGAVLEFRASRWREFSASLKAATDRELSNCAKCRKAGVTARNTTISGNLRRADCLGPAEIPFSVTRRPLAARGVTGRGAGAVPPRT
jgi:hypothetical protein